MYINLYIIIYINNMLYIRIEITQKKKNIFIFVYFIRNYIYFFIFVYVCGPFTGKFYCNFIRILTIKK